MGRALGIGLAVSVLVVLVAACAAAPSPTPTRAPEKLAPTPTMAVKPSPTLAAATEPKPAAQKPAEQKPVAQKPAEQKPVAQKPVTQEKPLDPRVTVTVGTLQGVSDAGIYIADARGYFEQEGIKIEYQVIKGAVESIALQATGELDVASPSPSAGFYNAVMRDVPIKLVADKGHIAAGQPFLGMVVRKDLADQINELPDLKGRTIAVNMLGQGTATTAVFTEKILVKAGLKLSDIKGVDMAMPQINVAMGNKLIEAAVQLEPMTSVGINQGLYVRWKGYDEFSLNHQIAGISYSPKFMKEKSEAAKRFMVAYLRGVRDFNDGFYKKKNWSEIVSILTRFTTAKDPALYEQMGYAGLHPDGTLNTKSMAEDFETFVRDGLVKERIDVSKIIETQYVEYALSRLGKYQP